MNYPNDIFTLIRKKTFSIEGHFISNFEESPMKIFHESFSKFKFNVICDGGAAFMNLHIDALPGIIAKTNVVANLQYTPKTSAVSFSGNNSPAFTTRFLAGELKGKTPVDVLIENGDQGPEILKKQYLFLQQNVAKYPGNQKLMDAIKDAAKLDRSTLSADTSIAAPVIKIVDLGCRPLTRKKRDDGKCLCYEGKVIWDGGKKYPVNVRIKNYYAPVTTKDDGTLNVNISGKDTSTELDKDFNMTTEEWLAAVDAMKSTRDEFRLCHFGKAYNLATAAGKENRENAVKSSRAS